MPALPFKLNQDRRHRIPKQKHKVTNWREYDESLRRRGSLTVWFSDEAVRAWKAEPRTSRGGQPWYSPPAILTALTLRAVFRLAFRQAEGLIGLDFAHVTPLGGQALIQNAGSAAMKASASAMGRTAPNGPAGPQASRRRQSTSTRSPGGSGLSRATGAPVRVEVRV